jgi:hypothetical protein
MPLCGAGIECKFPDLPLGLKMHKCFYCNKPLHGLCALEQDKPGRPQSEQDVCPACNDSHNLGLKKAHPIDRPAGPPANPEEPHKVHKRKQPSLIDISGSAYSPGETISTIGEESSRTSMAIKDSKKQRKLSSFFVATSIKNSSSKTRVPSSSTNLAPASRKAPPQAQSAPPLASPANLAPASRKAPPQAQSAPPLASPASTDKSGGSHAPKMNERPKFIYSKMPLIVDGVDITIMKKEAMKPNVIPPSEKKKAIWWRAYSMLKDGGNTDVAVCNCCGSQVRLSKDFSPTPLKKHLSSSHRSIYRYLLDITKGIHNNEIVLLDDAKQRTVGEYMDEKDDNRTKSEKRHDSTRAAVRATALWVAATDQPLNASSNKRFRAMQAAVVTAAKQQALYETGKDSIGDELAQLATEARRILMALMEGQAVTVTGDHWTSRAGDNYASMTAHWIDNNCVLQSAVLRVYVYHGSTCAINLVGDFFAQLAYWGLSIQQVPFVVTDTEAKMNAFGIRLEGENVAHLYCIDHVLQIVAKIAGTSLLKVDKPTDDDDISPKEEEDNRPAILKQCHRLIEHFTSSTQATEKLNTIQRVTFHSKQPLHVVQDVITRWWSTYAMVERLLLLRHALGVYDTDGHFDMVKSRAKVKARMLTKEEWTSLEHLLAVLKPFKLAQKFLEGEKHVTISYIPIIVNAIRVELTNVVEISSDDINTSVGDCARAMLESFESQFGGPGHPVFNATTVRGKRQRQVGVHRAVIFAHALDPRFKALKTIPKVERPAVWEALIDEVVQITDVSVGGGSDGTTPTLNDNDHLKTPPPVEKKKKSAFLDATPIKKHLQRLEADSDSETNSSQPDVLREHVSLQLKQYKCQRQADINTNPLAWWSERKDSMPLIWKYARMVLAIPATSAPSERAFSAAGNLVTQKRARLSGDKVEEILMVKENMDRLM